MCSPSPSMGMNQSNRGSGLGSTIGPYQTFTGSASDARVYFGRSGGRLTSGSIRPVKARMNSTRSARSCAVSPKGFMSDESHGFFTPPS